MAEVKEIVVASSGGGGGVEPPVAAAASPAPAPEKKDPVNLRPDKEHTLPDGKKLLMGKPSMPTHMLLPSLLASMSDPDRPSDRSKNELNARMCCFVRAINGRRINPPSSAAEVGLILHELGEDGCDIALESYVTYFAPITLAQLEQVKK